MTEVVINGEVYKLIPRGRCACGCGGAAPVAKQNHTKKGWVKGAPKQFIRGHHRNHCKGAEHPAWNGGRHYSEGYAFLLVPEHPRADKNGYVREHILIAEKALGKPLPPKAELHHHDGNPGNNDPGNLVVCQDNAFHKLLHQRQRALKACGHASWLKCRFCGEHDDPLKMYISPRGAAHHRECFNNYRKEKNQWLKSVA